MNRVSCVARRGRARSRRGSTARRSASATSASRRCSRRSRLWTPRSSAPCRWWRTSPPSWRAAPPRLLLPSPATPSRSRAPPAGAVFCSVLIDRAPPGGRTAVRTGDLPRGVRDHLRAVRRAHAERPRSDPPGNRRPPPHPAPLQPTPPQLTGSRPAPPFRRVPAFPSPSPPAPPSRSWRAWTRASR